MCPLFVIYNEAISGEENKLRIVPCVICSWLTFRKTDRYYELVNLIGRDFRNVPTEKQDAHRGTVFPPSGRLP